MPYHYLEDIATADIAFLATGKTLEELFQSSADALMNVMVEDLKTIEPRETRIFKEENADLELLLFDFLQELIFLKDSAQLLLKVEAISVKQENGRHALSATLAGEPLNPNKHEQRVDVKAVTLHEFKVEHVSDGWSARIILDI